jgi:organic hydroperoxide reductase OsmC/OhrA
VSQVAAKKKLVLQAERVKVIARFQEQGSVLQGTAEGWCNGFEIELRLESAEPAEEIAGLIRLAHRMCFTEAALTGRVELTQRHLLNGQPLIV